MWQLDGWDVRTRIGVLTPHADVGPESELQAMAPTGVCVYAARVPFGAMRTAGVMDPTIPLAPLAAFVEPPHIDEAASLLAAAPIAAIGIGFTSSSYVTGADAEKQLVDRLERTAGLPVVATCASAVSGFRSLGARRIALVHPLGSMLSSIGLAATTSRRRVSRLSSMHPATCRADSGASTHPNCMTGSWRTRRIMPTPSSSEATASGALA
jgi:hypothetical protein